MTDVPTSEVTRITPVSTRARYCADRQNRIRSKTTFYPCATRASPPTFANRFIPSVITICTAKSSAKQVGSHYMQCSFCVHSKLGIIEQEKVRLASYNRRGKREAKREKEAIDRPSTRK